MLEANRAPVRGPRTASVSAVELMTRVRLAAADNERDVDRAADLLHDFNTEFETSSPGPAVLRRRLETLLRSESTFAVLAGTPTVGIALVTLRSNVWSDGPVALLDEMYVAPDQRNKGIGGAMIECVRRESLRRDARLIEINVDAADHDAQRFYERHGFSGVDPDTGERAFYFSWSAEALA
jgi:GNAT superfamily N-acetyltransferase